MNSNIRTKRKARHSMLKKVEDVSRNRKANMPWLAKLMSELDLEVEEIIICR